MVDTSAAPKYKIGDRIECCGYIGTIKYIGRVEGQSAVWLGIDWDNPERGKHDGTVNGIKYFQTRHSKSGSFVRPQKIESGQSAVASIVTRYGHHDDAFASKVNQQQQLKFQQDINAPFVEMVGFDKVSNRQSDFNSLKIVNLRLQNVCCLGGAMELKNLCPNVQELDISKNLLSTWNVVFDICLELTHLHWLNVSDNILEIPENYLDYSFPSIKTLIVGYMHLTWTDVRKLIRIFPKIEELRAPHNDIDHLDCYEGDFGCLKILDIEGNSIEKWSEICKLDMAKKLDYLILENIGLTHIIFDEQDRKVVSLFKNLRKLHIVDNLIQDWQSIGELNRLENLEELKLNKNPLLHTENVKMARQLIIAQIATLKVLNGAIIDVAERRGAEYDYIKKYAQEWLTVKGTEERKTIFLTTHNRYLELIQKHGELEESDLAAQSKIIKSSLISLKLVHGPITKIKKVPLTISVQKFKLLVQKLFGLKRRPDLVYVSSSVRGYIQINLDDDLKELGLYSMQDGDEILVND